MEREPSAIAIFKLQDGKFFLMDSTGFSETLVQHLTDNPPTLDGNTHLARFACEHDVFEYGTLQNEMPGADFDMFAFQRCDFITSVGQRLPIIVGRYW